MIRALSVAATGLEAQQAKIENIANDLANVNTDGYKQSTTEFQDLMYETIKEPGGALGANSQSPVGIQAGMGVKVGATHKNFEQGPAKMTYNPFDFMIEGPGFFPVQTSQGEMAYTRNGAFHVDSQGILQLSNGSKIVPQIVIPANATNVQFSKSGEVRATIPGAGDAVLGQIQLVNFQNPQGLLAAGEGLYRTSLASGAPIQSLPGENGTGSLQQGALEGSNVNVANSMVDMITTQRAYEMGTKVMNTADQMLGATVNIK
jgi:flagellar basal-body rod protein FlgG